MIKRSADEISKSDHPNSRSSQRDRNSSIRRSILAADTGSSSTFKPKLTDDGVLSGGSAIIVRLHRLERENSALRRQLGIPEDSDLPANVFYGRSGSPGRSSKMNSTSTAHSTSLQSRNHGRLDVAQWTARHEQLKRLLEQRLGNA
uniref:Cnn_1N domain-containing protein n=1 Tax=Macrostomum lignano TaxID=282301 RepID=A0A1I8GJ55_9PLAT